MQCHPGRGNLRQQAVRRYYHRIQEALKQVVKKEVLVTVKEDPAIIGGIVAQVGDLLLDGSLQTQLKRLKESLRRGEGI
ncbi:MAG: hypothetical protein EHM75_07620 [Desulfobacteraceae bacterium]|nr:MAG: hypothetical protein EHM75_07620 [Desulfobacteraceae bacterium]